MTRKISTSIVMSLAFAAVAGIGFAAPVAPVKEAQAQVIGEKQVETFIWDFCIGKCKGAGHNCCGPSVQF